MKKTIAVILAVVLALSISVTTIAANDECDCGNVPVIYVTGFAATPLVANAGTENEYEVFLPNAEFIVACVIQLILPIVFLIISGDYDAFEKQVALAANNLFKDVMCDDNGNPLNDTVDVEERNAPTADHSQGIENTFRYDWREDVFEIAAELNDYVEQTKKLTGHSKVALEGESMGGAVVMTYLSVYGHDSVDSIIMQSSAYNGITLMGGLFTGDLDIKSNSVMNYIGNFIQGDDNTTVLMRALFMGLCNSIINPVSGLLDKVIKQIKDKLYEDCINNMIGNITGVWTFVPEEYYEQAKDYMLDETENAELIKKIDKYHYGVMDKTKELLDSAKKDGVRLAIISNYGKAGVPVTTNDSYQSDFLIDTSRTSLGATCAPYGTTFSADYKQAVSDGHNHISCDNTVDASTCMYPEQTWFIKDMMHTWYSTGYAYFKRWFIYSNQQMTVWSSAEYPQFLVNNHETQALEPLTVENMNTQSTNVNISVLINDIISAVR